MKIDPKRQWELVQPEIRKALLQRFHYDRSDLGQDLLLSDAIAVIQKVEGVLYVDVDKFDAVRQQDVSSLAARLNDLKRRPRIRVNLARYTSDNAELEEVGLPTNNGMVAPVTTPTPPSTDGSGNGSTKPDPNAPLIRAAQLCYLTPDIPDTLILEAIR